MTNNCSTASVKVIGVSGVSGAGKSTLVDALKMKLNATALFWDDYDAISKSPDDLVGWYEANRGYDEWVYDDLVNSLKKLKEGRRVICPATKRELFPTEYLLFDAPLGYCHKATGKYIDFLICLDTPLDIALSRRLLRDYKGHSKLQEILEDLEWYLTRSRPLFLLSPEQKVCDLLLDGSLPVIEQERVVLSVLKRMKDKEQPL